MIKKDHWTSCTDACTLTFDTNTAAKSLFLYNRESRWCGSGWDNKCLPGALSPRPHPTPLLGGGVVRTLGECYRGNEGDSSKGRFLPLWVWLHRPVLESVLLWDPQSSTDSRTGRSSVVIHYNIKNDHQSVEIPAPLSHRVGVYLDWLGGTMSFYNISSQSPSVTLIRTTALSLSHSTPGLAWSRMTAL